MSMQVGGSSQVGASSGASSSSSRVSLPGGSQVSAPGINGSLLDQVSMMAKSMAEAIASADAGIRSCQVK